MHIPEPIEGVLLDEEQIKRSDLFNFPKKEIFKFLENFEYLNSKLNNYYGPFLYKNGSVYHG